MNIIGRHITLILVLFWGFLLVPNLSYACSKVSIKRENQKVSKKHLEKVEKKDCCKTQICKKHQQDNDCSRSCKDNSCRCDNLSFSDFLPTHLQLNTILIFLEKSQYELTPTYCSLGYYSIWQPPKID